MNSLPLIRHSERVAFKRCQTKWYWSYKRGLVPREQSYGALSLGTWMHEALAIRYGPTPISLAQAFRQVTNKLMCDTLPGYKLDQIDNLLLLGTDMAVNYDRKYGDDTDVHPIIAEIPLTFTIYDEQNKLVATHKLKPDLVFRDEHNYVWLMEHKTAAQIRLEHLRIDDQARPYVAMAELALRRAGIITPDDVFKGVMYNFLRKIKSDTRPQNADGLYLNKDGSVSAKQPTPVFVRYKLEISKLGRLNSLRRLQNEAITITNKTDQLRRGVLKPEDLMKTPHSSCPKLCDYFTMCTSMEDGRDWRQMERDRFIRRNPYTYDEESTDTPLSFELS